MPGDSRRRSRLEPARRLSATASPRIARLVARLARSVRPERRCDRADRRPPRARLLDRLDLEAVFLYEKHPNEFRRLRDALSDDAAADVLLHWREYFGLKRADDTDRAILIAELAALSPPQRGLAAPLSRRPAPDPGRARGDVAELIESYGSDDQRRWATP